MFGSTLAFRGVSSENLILWVELMGKHINPSVVNLLISYNRVLLGNDKLKNIYYDGIEMNLYQSDNNFVYNNYKQTNKIFVVFGKINYVITVHINQLLKLVMS